MRLGLVETLMDADTEVHICADGFNRQRGLKLGGCIWACHRIVMACRQPLPGAADQSVVVAIGDGHQPACADGCQSICVRLTLSAAGISGSCLPEKDDYPALSDFCAAMAKLTERSGQEFLQRLPIVCFPSRGEVFRLTLGEACVVKYDFAS